MKNLIKLGLLVFGLLLILPGILFSGFKESFKDGSKVYEEKCMLCHGLNGKGWDWKQKLDKPPVPVPNLLDILPLRSDQYLEKVIK